MTDSEALRALGRAIDQAASSAVQLDLAVVVHLLAMARLEVSEAVNVETAFLKLQMPAKEAFHELA